MPSTPPSRDEIIARLCLKCGLCCDGSLFADVELAANEAARLKATGLRPRGKRFGSGSTAALLPQPCAALGEDCRCAVYEDRPRHCRDFECLLFQEVAAGAIRLASAQRVTRKACRLREEARELMNLLTDAGEGKPLRDRFGMIAEMLEEYDPDAETVAVFGELTMIWQDLVHLLGTRFYRES